MYILDDWNDPCLFFCFFSIFPWISKQIVAHAPPKYPQIKYTQIPKIQRYSIHRSQISIDKVYIYPKYPQIKYTSIPNIQRKSTHRSQMSLDKVYIDKVYIGKVYIDPKYPQRKYTQIPNIHRESIHRSQISIEKVYIDPKYLQIKYTYMDPLICTYRRSIDKLFACKFENRVMCPNLAHPALTLEFLVYSPFTIMQNKISQSKFYIL